MQIQSLKLVCFSPTGTTKKVIQAIAKGMNPASIELIDITKPESRKKPLLVLEEDLLLVAVPVYMGRVPALLGEWLHSIEARDTPAIPIVVYGNRAFENALLELKDILKNQGCKPIAGAAYIGEHAFSSSDLPTAEGRPDKSDQEHAEWLGRMIDDKLRTVSSVDELEEIEIPGEYPYGGITDLWNVDFIAVGDTCTQCGLCAEVCPVGAIDPENSRNIDQEKCVTCCACIKSCPEGARTMKAGPVKDAAMRLNSLFKERKEPLAFI